MRRPSTRWPRCPGPTSSRAARPGCRAAGCVVSPGRGSSAFRAVHPPPSRRGRAPRGPLRSITRRGSMSVRAWLLRMTGNATGIGCSKPRFPCATGYGSRADMKSSRSFSQRGRARAPRRARQGGTILIIALIVLVAMTLAGIATMRSVDTATITAGNIELRQALVHAADQGIQAGVAWLTANLGPTLINDNHQSGTASKGYFSSVAANDPDWYDPLNWGEAGQLKKGKPHPRGKTGYFLIHPLCAIPHCDTHPTRGA